MTDKRQRVSFASPEAAIQYLADRSDALLQNEIANLEMTKIILRALVDLDLITAENLAAGSDKQAETLISMGHPAAADTLSAIADRYRQPDSTTPILRLVPPPTGDIGL